MTVALLAASVAGCSCNSSKSESEKSTTTKSDESNESTSDDTSSTQESEDTTTESSDESTTDNTTENTTTNNEQTTKPSSSNSNNSNSSNNNNPLSKLSGKDITKLLLANKRLDSSLLKDSNDILLADTSEVIRTNMSSFIECALRPNRGSLISPKATCTISGSTYKWSGFDSYCNITSFFNSYENAIKGCVEQTSDAIDYAKQYIGGLDVWVPGNVDSQYYMLSVSGNAEYLYEKDSLGYSVCSRYANDEGKNVYEIYDYQNDSTNGVTKTYMLYIPDERYEFSLDMGQKMNLYVIAENTRGYWNMYYVSDMGDHANATNLMSTSKIGYQFDYMLGSNYQGGITGSMTFVSQDKTCDYIKVNGNTVTLLPCGFNGIKSFKITASGNEVVNQGNESSTTKVIKNSEGSYFTYSGGVEIELSSGNVIKQGDTFCDGKVKYNYGNVTLVADYGYYPDIQFEVEGDSVDEIISNFTQFLTANSITCKGNIQNIIDNAVTGDILLNQFPASYEWNGYTLDTYANIKSAISKEKTSFTTFDNMYNKVKNNKTATITQLGNSLLAYDFAKLDSFNAGKVTYNNGKLTVSGMSATLKDFALVDKNGKYCISLALASVSESDSSAFDLCTMVPLESSNKQFATYTSGDAFTLSQSADFDVNVSLPQGTYYLVAYVSTEDGLPVSVLTAVNPSSTISGGDSTIQQTIGCDGSGRITFTYTVSYDVYIEADKSLSSYSYEEIQELLLSAVINEGIPTTRDVEIKSGSTWVVADSSAAITGSIVRMEYTKSTPDGDVTAYVYLEGK